MKRRKHIWTGVAAVLSLLMGCSPRPYGMGGGDWGHMMNYGYGGVVMWLLIILLIAVAAFFLFTRFRIDDRHPTEEETALDILKKRYARGEISREEFMKMKGDVDKT